MNLMLSVIKNNWKSKGKEYLQGLACSLVVFGLFTLFGGIIIKENSSLGETIFSVVFITFLTWTVLSSLGGLSWLTGLILAVTCPIGIGIWLGLTIINGVTLYLIQQSFPQLGIGIINPAAFLIICLTLSIIYSYLNSDMRESIEADATD